MAKKILLTAYHGKNKEGKEYDAYKLTAGKFTRLFFVNDPIVRDYLDGYITDTAHSEFKDDLDDEFAD